MQCKSEKAWIKGGRDSWLVKWDSGRREVMLGCPNLGIIGSVSGAEQQLLLHAREVPR